jgi:sugar phosphate isomerase/epimerase
MQTPYLACCNFLPKAAELRVFALDHGFQGVDWSFRRDDLPQTPAEEDELADSLAALSPLEVRYHCALENADLGDEDSLRAHAANRLLKHVCRLVARLGGRHLTIHVGLGRDSTEDLCWAGTVTRLAELAAYAGRLGVRLCLENLAWGWTSRPELFEKLLRASGCWATFDIGHARVSPAVRSRFFEVADFVAPHPTRFLNAHIYHEETATGHEAPATLGDLADRLRLLASLPRCRWWVLELHAAEPLLQTLRIVREFFRGKAQLANSPAGRSYFSSQAETGGTAWPR